MPAISVVIPCLNEEKYVGKLLDDLAVQTIKPAEVVVADCRSDDKTIEVAKTYKDKLPISTVISKIRTPGAARNAGAKAAGSEYLLFVDADMRIPRNTVELIKNSLSEKPVDFLTPAYRSDGQSFVDSFNTWLVNVWMFGYLRAFHTIFGIGGVMCVKRKFHQTIGGFNEKMVVQGDINYIYKLRRAKASYTYLRALRAVNSSRRWSQHSVVIGLLQLLVQNSRLGRFVLTPLASRLKLEKKYGHYK